jgi:pimeloyl-ACP methyl ester carboxylesterase
MSKKRFHYAFANRLTTAESDEAFDTYAVPESRNVPRRVLSSQGRIHFRRDHAPLLILTGDADHLTPLDAVRRNARAYRHSNAPVECEVFAGRGHYICSEPGWEDVADRGLAFLREHAR